jgi:hypothetical protein
MATVLKFRPALDEDPRDAWLWIAELSEDTPCPLCGEFSLTPLAHGGAWSLWCATCRVEVGWFTGERTAG